MKTTLEKTALDLLGLPTSARAMLAEKLLASLEKDEPSDAIERAWNKEALKRYKAFKAGKVKVLSHADVMRDAYLAVGAK
jgi:Putative addiction module component